MLKIWLARITREEQEFSAVTSKAAKKLKLADAEVLRFIDYSVVEGRTLHLERWSRGASRTWLVR